MWTGISEREKDVDRRKMKGDISFSDSLTISPPVGVSVGMGCHLYQSLPARPWTAKGR